MKILASDFDNTLLFDGKMKEKDIKAIKELQKQGHLFGLCTGRGLKGVERPSLPYDIHYDFYILTSGSLILNKDKEVLFEKKIPMSLVKEIFEFMDQENASVIVNNEMYKVYHRDEEPHHYGHYIQSFDEIDVDEVSAFSFHMPHDRIDLATQATNKILKEYGDKVEAFQNNIHIDLAMKGCSKGNGIHFIQEYFHVDMNNIYCIGDSFNDLPMLKETRNSFSFTYAPDLLKKQVKYIVEGLNQAIDIIIED